MLHKKKRKFRVICFASIHDVSCITNTERTCMLVVVGPPALTMKSHATLKKRSFICIKSYGSCWCARAKRQLGAKNVGHSPLSARQSGCGHVLWSTLLLVHLFQSPTRSPGLPFPSQFKGLLSSSSLDLICL